MSDKSKVVFVKDGHRTEVEVLMGTSMLHAATDNLVNGIIGECGGDLSCATCHVFVEPEWFDRLPSAESEELEMLEATAEEPTEFSRLSCQLSCVSETDGIVLHIPDSQ
ncbi:2Fe-2S iron-sulfur cluster-binding protein [Williamsia soli]|uniref:2Fe-2S iron-sulfur cluster-binding protein n=1 Tax=Williamsia soli TaxID=364929 RepID=UPI001A9D089D|nr:2Fe-2S iron-sulfur cluster-binding protein [Williamsia soli]